MTPGALPTSLGMPPRRCSGGLTSFSHPPAIEPVDIVAAKLPVAVA